MFSDEEIDHKNFEDDDKDTVNPRAHKNLLQAISSLGKAQHIRRTTRNESERQPDEFQLVKNASVFTSRRPTHPVGIQDIVHVLKDTSKHVKVGRNLRNVNRTTKVVPVPLEKPAAERIKRTIGYENVKAKLARWDAVVAKNRSTETQVFPLASETVYIDTSGYTKPLELSVKSDLALEMEATDAKLAMLKRERYGDNNDPKDLEAEHNQLLQKKLTRDEIIARRKELSYLKMRQSQKSAKARIQNKIKSKKYHKLLKRQKMQEQIKEFDLLQKTNPEAALEKLDMLEKNRVLERANLRHKNTGTWAKNLQVRAKYDKDVRKDLAEQLQISRQLTQKKHESDEEDVAELDSKKDIEEQNALNCDPFNPWTRTQNNKAKEELPKEGEESYRKYWAERNKNEKLLEEFKNDFQADAEITTNDITKIKPITEQAVDTKYAAKLNSKKLNKKNAKLENGWIVEELEAEKSKTSSIDIDDIFDAEEDRQANALNKKLKILGKEAKRLSKLKVFNGKSAPQKKKPKNELKNLSDLTFKETVNRPIVDEALNGDNEDSIENDVRLNKIAAKAVENNSKVPPSNNSADVIDPNQIAPVKLKQLIKSVDLLGTAEYDDDTMDPDEHDLTAQQMTISQAFIDDDIVADFSKDKSEKSKVANDEIELTMPGWGSWAGAGISKDRSHNRNKRLVLKLAPEEQRRDENKCGTYINEEASKGLRKHLVSDLPFPFTSLQDYEASIRAPIGRNFVTETAFRNLTRPSVITRKGQVIEPMDESELVKRNKKVKDVVQLRIQKEGLK